MFLLTNSYDRESNMVRLRCSRARCNGQHPVVPTMHCTFFCLFILSCPSWHCEVNQLLRQCEPKIERDGKKYPPQGPNPIIGAISGAVGGLWKMIGGGEKKKADAKGTGELWRSVWEKEFHFLSVLYVPPPKCLLFQILGLTWATPPLLKVGKLGSGHAPSA